MHVLPAHKTNLHQKETTEKYAWLLGLFISYLNNYGQAVTINLKLLWWLCRVCHLIHPSC